VGRAVAIDDCRSHRQAGVLTHIAPLVPRLRLYVGTGS
jgi:hypothetical protein